MLCKISWGKCRSKTNKCLTRWAYQLIAHYRIQFAHYRTYSEWALLVSILFALDPLSKLLKHQYIGYNIGKVRGPEATRKIMNDIKLCADSEDHLQKLIQVAHCYYSNDIHMEFGLDKCGKCTLRKPEKWKPPTQRWLNYCWSTRRSHLQIPSCWGK